MIPGAQSTKGDWITLTEEQQGGTAPEPEAVASVETPASEETVAAIAVADEPVEPEPTTEPETTAQPEDFADAPPAAAEEDETVPAPAMAIERTA